MSVALAIKYRPSSFDDLTEQESVVAILKNQIETNTIKHGYLFCGGAGTGKTTSARIFASMINGGAGKPIELDAASNNSVEDIRRLSEDAQTKAIDCEYKVFIVDECHSLSNQAWQAMLKTLEEPPAKSIFIFCTTNPEKVPATILSRVQRYNFQRISHQGIVDRLKHILDYEGLEHFYTVDAVEYIAKIADGGMRDAITMVDKCLSYSNELTLDTVIKALGVSDYNTMLELNKAVFSKDEAKICKIISDVYSSGVDLKLFAKSYFDFILNLNIYRLSKDLSNTNLPSFIESEVGSYKSVEWNICRDLMELLVNIQSEIKWEQNPKAILVARFMIFVGGLDNGGSKEFALPFN